MSRDEFLRRLGESTLGNMAHYRRERMRDRAILKMIRHNTPLTGGEIFSAADKELPSTDKIADMILVERGVK